MKNNIENYNNKYKQIELLVHKLQLENATKNIEISRLRKEIQEFRKNEIDTSVNFPLPNEFKSRWDTLIKTTTMDAFENIAFNAILLMKVINIITNIVFEISKMKIKQKVSEILKCLGMNCNKEENIKKFFEKFKKLIFQDYFNTTFKINDNEFTDEVISSIKKNINLKQNDLFSSEEKTNILKDLNGQNINIFLIELYNLCLYMNINEPQLTIKTSTEINYKYFNRKKYSNIEGFSKENDICLLILNPPVNKNNINYKGIKPTVFIIDNPTKEIKDLCQKQNKNDNPNEDNKMLDKSKSFSQTFIFHNYNENKIDDSNLDLTKVNFNYSNSIIPYLENNNSKNKTDRILNNTKDDYNYIYKINFENMLNNIKIERNNKSFKSEFSSINQNTIKKTYPEITKSETILKSHGPNIKILKKTQTRNISYTSFHDSQNIPKKYNHIKKNNIKKKSKSNKSSSPFSPKKSPSFYLDKDKHIIKNLINIINARNLKFTNYKSEKFIDRKRKNLKLYKENSNILLKLKGLNQFKEFCSYIRKRNKLINSNKEEEKTLYNNTIEGNEKCSKNKKINNFNLLKETIPIVKIDNNITNIEIDKTKVNNLSIKRSTNIPFTNKINQSEPNILNVVEDIKPIRKYIQIPYKTNQNYNIKLLEREKIMYKHSNNTKNKDSSNSCSCCNTNGNVLTTNNNYKTNNNSLLSNHNYDNMYVYIKNNFKNGKKNHYQQSGYNNRNRYNNSMSIKKIEQKVKHFSSNGIKIKRKKYIYNKIHNDENKNNKKLKRNNEENKYNSNFNLYDKKNKESSYFSLCTSNSQVYIHNNKLINKNIKSDNKIRDSDSNQSKIIGREESKKTILLYKRNVNDLNIKKKINENLFKINLNTEKNEYKNNNIESLRIMNKYDNDFKYKKFDNKRNYNDKSKEKKIFLDEGKNNKENKINNIIDISKNNIDKFGEDIFNNDNKNKNKGIVKNNNNKKLHFYGLLTFNDKIIQNNI